MNILNMFLCNNIDIIAEAVGDNKTKDGEKTKDPELDKNEDIEDTKKKKDEEDTEDDTVTDTDDENEDDLFNDVDTQVDDSGLNDDQDDSMVDTDNTDDIEGDDNTDDLGTDDASDDLDSTDDMGGDDSSDDMGDDNMDDGSSDDMGDDIDESDPEEDEAIKLKNKKLLDDYFKLYSNIADMINLLANVNEHNKIEFSIFSKLSDNLQSLKYSINDYINIRFNTCSYEQNLAMYFKIANSVKITDKIISNIIENRNKH